MNAKVAYELTPAMQAELERQLADLKRQGKSKTSDFLRQWFQRMKEQAAQTNEAKEQ